MFIDFEFLVAAELGDRVGWTGDLALGVAAITCTAMGFLLKRSPDGPPISNNRNIPNPNKWITTEPKMAAGHSPGGSV